MDNHVSGQKFNILGLVRLQTILITLLVVWFIVSSLLTRLGFYPDTFPPAGRIGLVAIILGTFARLIQVAEQFRRARLYRLWLLGYMLILLIMAPVVAGYFQP